MALCQITLTTCYYSLQSEFHTITITSLNEYIIIYNFDSTFKHNNTINKAPVHKICKILHNMLTHTRVNLIQGNKSATDTHQFVKH